MAPYSERFSPNGTYKTYKTPPASEHWSLRSAQPLVARASPRPRSPVATAPPTLLACSWVNLTSPSVTDLTESGAGDETIGDIAGHDSKQMLKH